MTLSSGSGSDPFTSIRKRFIERCRSDLHNLEDLKSAGTDDPDALSRLIGVAHSLAGAGGIFGFPEISNKASELETRLIEGGSNNRADTALDELIRTLKEISASSS